MNLVVQQAQCRFFSK